MSEGFEAYLKEYRKDPEAAKAFLSHGDSPVDESIDTAELSAYTAVANVLLNLDETINKE